MEIARPAQGIVVVTISGSDVGEFHEAPFLELEQDIERFQRIELFIDGRDTRGASIDVSSEWACWLNKRRESLNHVTMLVGTTYIHVTADFVRRFAGLQGVMHITSNADAFEEALADSLRARK